MNKSDYLKDVLETHKMSKIQTLVNKYNDKRSKIESSIKEHYGSNMYSSFMSGSFAKHTATNIKFDMDVVIPFKRDSFDTLQNMFDDIYTILANTYTDAQEIRKQKVSVGITFKKDDDGDQVQIDVVPGRELTKDDYKDSNDLHLYFNDDHWGFKKGTWTKTNIQAQIDNIKGKKSEREVIRLLKIWKKRLNKDYKSFMLELFVIKSFTNYEGSNDLWERLKHAMQYIADHITDDNFKLIDPGNSNNDVLSSMDSFKKQLLASDMLSIISNVESNDENIKVYFKKNEKFQSNDRQKGFGENVISYPPTGKRFG